jgi:hypothetical protein
MPELLAAAIVRRAGAVAALLRAALVGAVDGRDMARKARRVRSW